METAIHRGDHPEMSVKRTGCPPKERSVFRLSGFGTAVNFGVHNNSVNNLRRGVMERVFFVEKDGVLAPPPRPATGVFEERLATFVRLLRRKLPHPTPFSNDQFVGAYDGRRRTVYANAVESLLARGVAPKDAFLSTFVKAEKINFTSKPDPAPRVIQPRDPRYNVCVGKYIKPIEHGVYEAIGEVYGGPTVMKGFNAHDTAKYIRDMWEEFTDPVAVGLDASRFDQHVSADALRWEHMVYGLCYHGMDRAELLRLLQWQLTNKGYGRASDGSVKYTVHGNRMSGDMNTALGNCLIMCAMVWAYSQLRGVRVRLADNGDDCSVIMERKDLARWMAGLKEWFTEMGFTMKVEEPVFVFEQIEFCQTHPVWDGARWVMVRNLYQTLAKDAHSMLPLDQRTMALGYCTAVGECGMALTGGVPVFQDYYSALLRAGGGVRIGQHPGLESGFARLARGMSRHFAVPTPEARVSFWKAFGVTPDEQEGLEWYLGALEFEYCKPAPGEKIDQQFPVQYGEK